MAVVSAPSLAVAEESDATEPEVVVTGLDLRGFDADIAAANGYEIRTTDDGRQYSVPVGTSQDYVPDESETAPAPGASGPQTRAIDVRYGDCGWSSLLVNQTRWSTAYEVTHPVLFGKWGVSIVSSWGVSNYNLDHGPQGTTWTSSGAVVSQHFGGGDSRVNDGSFVQMNNGGQCWSGLPKVYVYFQ